MDFQRLSSGLCRVSDSRWLGWGSLWSQEHSDGSHPPLVIIYGNDGACALHGTIALAGNRWLIHDCEIPGGVGRSRQLAQREQNSRELDRLRASWLWQ